MRPVVKGMHHSARSWRVAPALGLLLLGLASGGLLSCRQDMHDQAKYEPLEASDFFVDGQSSRPWPEGTIGRGQLRTDAHFFQGKVSGQWALEFPIPVDMTLLERGRERYDIFCTPCHGGLGNGRGMIVERGLKQPPSFHDPRLVEAPAGYYYNVMSNGFGIMYSYASRLTPRDRWAVVAYIRALQYSQAAAWEDLSPEDQRRLEEQRR